MFFLLMDRRSVGLVANFINRVRRKRFFSIFLIFIILIMVLFLVGFYMTGVVILEDNIFVKVESTDLETNDTYQNLNCIVNINSIEENSTFTVGWKKNSDNFISFDWFDLKNKDYLGKGIFISDNIYIVGVKDAQKGFVSKYDLNGVLIWERIENSSSGISGEEISVDSLGNLYVLFSDTDSTKNVLMISYDSSGNERWRRKFIEGGYYDYPYDILIDENDSIYVLTESKGDVGDLYQNRVVRLSKYNSSGSEIFVVNSTFNDVDRVGFSLNIDSYGNVYIFGRIQNVNEDIYLMKYNSSGSLIWNRTYDVSGNDRSFNSFFYNNSFYVSAVINSYLSEGDLYLARYDLNGDLILDKTFDNFFVAGSMIEDFGSIFSDIDDVGFYVFYYTSEPNTRTSILNFDYEFNLLNNYSKFNNNFSTYSRVLGLSNSGELYATGWVRDSVLDHYLYIEKWNFIDTLFNLSSGEDNFVSKIFNHETNLGDNFSCFINYYDNDIYQYTVYSGDVKIFGDLFSIVPIGNDILNQTYNETIDFFINCLYGDCGDVNLTLSYNYFPLDSEGVIEIGPYNFTKGDYEDVSYPGCISSGSCDCITENVCITRDDRGPLYNAITQTMDDVLGSCEANPDGTMWAEGVCGSQEFSDFGNLFSLYGGCDPLSFVDENMCLYLIEEDVYFDIVFNSWSSSDSGGGFSYSILSNVSIVKDPGKLIFENLNKVVNLGSGSESVRFPVYYNSSPMNDYEYSLSGFLVAKPDIVYVTNSTIISVVEFREEEDVEDVGENLTEGETVGGVGIYYNDSFEVYPNELYIDLFLGEYGQANFSVYNNMSGNVEFFIHFEGAVSEFIEVGEGKYNLGRGANLFSFDIFVSENYSKGNYSGKIILNSPINKEINLVVEVLQLLTFEEILGDAFLNETILLDFENFEGKLIEDNEGNLVEVALVNITMDYIDFEKYRGEILNVNYDIVDNLGVIRYKGNNDIFIDDYFNGSVELYIPKNLEPGNYSINTRVKTPDNFLITGKHSILIEESAPKLPFWPTFITISIVLIMGFILWRIVGKNEEE
jgi:hypothetical protein